LFKAQSPQSLCQILRQIPRSSHRRAGRAPLPFSGCVQEAVALEPSAGSGGNLRAHLRRPRRQPVVARSGPPFGRSAPGHMKALSRGMPRGEFLSLLPARPHRSSRTDSNHSALSSSHRARHHPSHANESPTALPVARGARDPSPTRATLPDRGVWSTRLTRRAPVIGRLPRTFPGYRWPSPLRSRRSVGVIRRAPHRTSRDQPGRSFRRSSLRFLHAEEASSWLPSGGGVLRGSASSPQRFTGKRLRAVRR
jgi:hypothetical protein